MKSLVLSALCVLSFSASAVKLSDYQPYDYKVVFTNPICPAYEYENPVLTNGGDYVTAKPANVFCKRGDAAVNGRRDDTPKANILKLINDPATKELFLTYLSFSERDVAKALCDAIEKKNVKITFIIDSMNEQTPEQMEMHNSLKNCKADSEDRNPTLLTRGNVGGIGFAHNKIIIQNPKSRDAVTVVFSSGNMSSGTLLHHENWHFVKTNVQSYFVQKHLCLMEGMLNHGSRAAEYKAWMKECLAKIETEEESDIQMFSVPGDGEEAMAAIKENAEDSKIIFAAAHRFSNKDLDAIFKTSLNKGNDVRLVAEDDIYWSGITHAPVGASMVNEYYNVTGLVREGMKVRYMETNQDSKYLHHNKFLIFDKSVFTGAGNMTKSAFTSNFENFYLIKIPAVVKAFQNQYDKLWNELATPFEKMPKEYVMPKM